MTALLRLPEVLRRTGMCRASVYAGMAAGTFPRALKRGKVSLWVDAEIEAFVAKDVATLPRLESGTTARQIGPCVGVEPAAGGGEHAYSVG